MSAGDKTLSLCTQWLCIPDAFIYLCHCQLHLCKTSFREAFGLRSVVCWLLACAVTLHSLWCWRADCNRRCAFNIYLQSYIARALCESRVQVHTKCSVSATVMLQFPLASRHRTQHTRLDYVYVCRPSVCVLCVHAAA